MKGLTVYASNRMEKLLDALAGVIEKPLSGALDPEIIVVQSKGMQRWLSWKLAERLDVFANARFPFPNALVGEFFEAAGCKPVDAAFHTRELMTWRIMGILPGLFDSPPFAPLRSYLAREGAGLKGFQLATRIADAFDQYTLYRPDMVLEWDRGSAPDDWQAILWRELCRGHENGHRAAIRQAFISRMETPPPEGALPGRIAIFGIPAMPKFHFEVFNAIARHCEVNLFFLNPSVEFWGDILSPKALVREKIRCRLRKQDPEAQHLAVGNPLLGSLGKLGRDFFNLLVESGGSSDGEAEFVDPAETDGSVLASIQSDILLLVDRGEAKGAEARSPFPAEDGSIRVHAVHGPMREMEVLHDQLLDLFERIEGLEPHDIVVMAPDIDACAPFVTAVFGSIPPTDPRHIPWSLSDRSARSENEPAKAFMKLVSLGGSRLGASEVSELVELPAVGRKFGFDPEQVERIHRWIADTRIRWGIDADDRALHGVPPFPGNTWAAGFDRLLLGYALMGDDGTLFRGLLPHEGIEGADALTLGRFIAFFRAVSASVRELEVDRTLPAWSDFFQSLLSGFVDESDEDGEAFQEVRKRLIRLGRLAGESGFEGKVPIDVVRHWLEGEFDADRGGRGFLSRGVTFCEMLPMRSIPFRVVALVGMDNGAFPRQDRPPGFDKIADRPMPGDRSLREEDRYLFLEALLSARDCFYVSFVGRSIVDNSDIPPSVLVSELVDAIGQRYAPPAGYGQVEDILVEKHPLQPFSPAYFAEPVPGKGKGLFSYSAENLEALAAREAFRISGKASAESVPAAPPFLREPLPPPADAWRHVTIGDLKKFFRGPAEYFLKERVLVRIDRATEATDDHEPFQLDRLDEYRLKAELTERMLDGEPTGPLEAAFLAGGMLPPGAPGRMALEDASADAESFARRVSPWHAERLLEPVDVDLALGAFRLTGLIDGVREGGLLRYRCADVRPKDRIAAWIDHLALQAQLRLPSTTRLVGADKACGYAPADDPVALLASLVDLYWRGLSEPLPFFPEASFAWFESVRSGKRTPDAAFADFLRSWKEGAGSDAWNSLAFGEAGGSVERGCFAGVAGAVFSAMIGATAVLS